jgi:hypothetical protein
MSSFVVVLQPFIDKFYSKKIKHEKKEKIRVIFEILIIIILYMFIISSKKP